MAKVNKGLIYVKKGILPGTYIEASKEEQKQATMLVVNRKVFNEVVNENYELNETKKSLAEANKNYENLVAKYNELVESYNNDVYYKIENIENKAKKTKEENEQIRQENIALKAQNASLHRQYIETMNRQKGLTPAKKHSGYCVKQDNIKTQYCKSAEKTAYFREAIISTPYSLNMNMGEAEDCIIQDVISKQILRKLNLGEQFQSAGLNSYLHTIARCDDGWDQHYFICGLRMNTRDDCWEMIIYHPNPIMQVPEDMKPQTLIKKDKERKKEEEKQEELTIYDFEDLFEKS